MALRQLLITRNKAEKENLLETARAKDAGFLVRKTVLETREAELEAAVNEVTDDTPAADKQAVEDSVAQLEADQKALEDEQAANEAEKQKLTDEINGLIKELDDLNARAKKPAATPAQRKDDKPMSESTRGSTRAMVILGANHAERSTFVARTEIKDFLQRVRSFKSETRAVTGAELGIPTVLLDLLRDNLHRYSKLITRVRLKPVSGKARQNITGAVPEGVWTEAVASLNELALVFNQIEVDGFKVGGYVPIANSILEDSDDINLAAEIMDALGQAIGLALDKAIVYGTGTKMPVGIVTRLAQASQPSNWGANAPTWADLRTSNILKFDPTSMTAQQFYAALILKLGVAAPNYATAGTWWAMNRKTRMTLMSKSIEFNAAGALVAGANGTMPVEGGEIVELPFIPDNDIVGGFGSLYLLAERAGASLESSEHVKFIEDQTVFKGTARYDGRPVRGEAFVAVNIANTNPTTSVSFASDTANP